MASTYTPITSVTANGSTNTYTLSSIPSTYTDLVLIVMANAGGLDYLDFRFNSDSGTNYSNTQLYGTGSAAGSARSTNANNLVLTTLPGSGGFSIARMNLQNYSNTTTYKTMITRTDYPAGQVDAHASLWRSTSAINSITIYTNGSNNFSSGSTFTLYGVLNA